VLCRRRTAKKDHDRSRDEAVAFSHGQPVLCPMRLSLHCWCALSGALAKRGSQVRTASPSRPFQRGRLVRQGRYSRQAARRSAPTVGYECYGSIQVPCTS